MGKSRPTTRLNRSEGQHRVIDGEGHRAKLVEAQQDDLGWKRRGPASGTNDKAMVPWWPRVGIKSVTMGSRCRNSRGDEQTGHGARSRGGEFSTVHELDLGPPTVPSGRSRAAAGRCPKLGAARRIGYHAIDLTPTPCPAPSSCAPPQNPSPSCCACTPPCPALPGDAQCRCGAVQLQILTSKETPVDKAGRRKKM
jgi:hypothetical protein